MKDYIKSYKHTLNYLMKIQKPHFIKNICKEIPFCGVSGYGIFIYILIAMVNMVFYITHVLYLSLISGANISVPHFSGFSYLEFPGLNRSVLTYMEVEILIKPTKPEGLILYNGCLQSQTGDFISLSMHDGYMEFKFDLGSGPAKIRWDMMHLYMFDAIGKAVG